MSFERTIQMENHIILPVFGQFDAYMKKIEKTLHVSLILRGDHLKCIGTQQAVNHAISVIDELLELSKRGNVITEQNVNYALSLSMEEKSFGA